MRCTPLVAVVALAACGSTAPRPTGTATAVTTATATATPTEVVAAAPSGPWSAPVAGHREPPKCPVASSRAGWPSRVLALGDGKYAKLWGQRPRLADVDADGHLLGQTELGARRPAATRALACGRDGRLAVAWVEYRGDATYRLRVVLRSPGGELTAPKTVASARAPFDDAGVDDAALAFAPDGELLIAYSIFGEVRAARVSRSGEVGRSFKLGPASEITQLAAVIGSRGRAVVAWSTYDGGEEQNVARRIYAATRASGAREFTPAALIHRSSGRNEFAFLEPGIRLAVAPNGRALLMWRAETGSWPRSHHPVRLAEAAPTKGFGPSRRLATDGIPGDVAIRSNGTALATWRSYGRLRAAVRAPGTAFGKPERIAGPEYTEHPSASFSGGRPRVEWEGHASTRTAP